MSEIDKTKIKANSQEVDDKLQAIQVIDSELTAILDEAADENDDEHAKVMTFELDDEDKGLKVLRENLGRAIKEAARDGRTLPIVLVYNVNSKQIETIDYEGIFDDIPCGCNCAALIEFKR